MASTHAASRTTSGTTLAVDPNPNPPVPSFEDDHEWVTAYLTIHRLSTPSYRYMYIFWLAVVLVLVVFVVLHWTSQRDSVLGGVWSKWSIRRRTWRKRHRLKNAPHKQPLALPSNAQLLTLGVLYTTTLLLCFLGPDYIAPSIHVWDLTNPSPTLQPPDGLQNPTPVSQPNYSISKAWWTAGGRTGTIAFALFPLCVLFALKSPPFALFAIPFLIQIYNDKLAFLHRWCGRLIWFVTALHVALWGVQLSLDKRSADDPSSVWLFAFGYYKFVFGWLGFICLTLLVALSLRPVRTDSYELFYAFHALLVPLTLAFSALHFPLLGWWCWAALAIWVAERLWRLTRFLRINGIIGRIPANKNVRYFSSVYEKASGYDSFNQQSPTRHISDASARARGVSDPLHRPQFVPSMEVYPTQGTDDPEYGLRSRVVSVGQETLKTAVTGSSMELVSRPTAHTSQPEYLQQEYIPSPAARLSFQSGLVPRKTYTPPRGYAHAVLLPGRTIRLRLITPHPFTWAPGQHALLTLPSISRVTSHPFTIASICDREGRSEEGREIVIIVRARTGFTKDLWSQVERLEKSGQVGDVPAGPYLPPSNGVLLRTYIDGPFGSSIRTCWTSYSTVLILAGGSGVSFAVSVLEYVCMCMAGRNGRLLGGKTGGWDAISQISRIRFVWIIREYSHMQWVATTIRRCMDIVPRTALDISIFVTNAPEKPSVVLPSEMHPRDNDTLAPPNPHYLRPEKSSNPSEISLASTMVPSGVSGVSDAGPPPTESDHGTDLMDIVEMYSGHEEHELDLTNFDGEDDTHLPGERKLSRRLKKEGKLRREKTRVERARLGRPHTDRRPAIAPLPPIPQGRYASFEYPGFLSAPAMEAAGSPATTAESGRSPTLAAPFHPLEIPSSPLSAQSYRSNAFLLPSPGEVSRSSSPSPSMKSDAPTVLDPNRPQTAAHFRRPSNYDIDEAEAEDLAVVAEHAHPGRAKIDRILADEMARSRGSMVVAYCGPTSLNALVRKCVAAQINPSRIFRGDERASLALVSEDFEY